MHVTKRSEAKESFSSAATKSTQLEINETDSKSNKFPQNELLPSENQLRTVTSLQNLFMRSPKLDFAHPNNIENAGNRPPKSLNELPAPKVKTSNKTALPRIVIKSSIIETGESNLKANETKNQKLLPENTDNSEKEPSNGVFGSRYALYLQNLENNAKEKRLNEEMKKKQKESQLAKIRDNMGLSKVQSKLVSLKKPGSQNFDMQPAIQVGDEANIKKSNQENLLGEDLQALKLPTRKISKLICGPANPNRGTVIVNRSSIKASTIVVTRVNRHYSTTMTNLDQAKPENTRAELQNASVNNTQLESSKKQKNDLNIEEGEGALRREEEKKAFERRREESIKAAVLKNGTDLARWKKVQDLDPQTKVFIVLGGYGDLKRALRDRGWVENPERNSACFDLKWATNESDIWEGYLDDNQLANHYPGNGAIVTKAGLCRSLKLMPTGGKVDPRSYYPRCYDMNASNDIKMFEKDFKLSKAESILKIYLNSAGKVGEQLQEKAAISLKVCQRYLKEMNQIHAFDVSKEDWEVLASDEMSHEELAIKKHTKWLKKMKSKGKRKRGKRKAKKIVPENVEANKKDQDAKTDDKVESTKEEIENKDNVDDQEEESSDEPEAVEDTLVDNKLLQDTKDTLESLKATSSQYDLNLENNIWIVKPARLSRGRGIACHRNLVEILDRTKQGGHWVVQKYIENPLIIHKRKFDIRQWVLVTDWSPMTVWFYEECYLRFGAMEFDNKKLDNRFIHLTNNSVTKHCKVGAEEEIEGNMWTCQEFEEYLKTNGPKDANLFAEKIKPSMKQIVNWSLQSAQKYMEVRKNCFELYGYDFMVDENYNVWLIEVNCSPAMDYSTEVTKRLVKMVLEDTVKVVVDAKMGKKKKANTGLFTCIYREHKFNYVKAAATNGKDTVVEGKIIDQQNNCSENNKRDA